ncbi:hypothetical protein AKO1_004592 [Acrasis kona]|uniref:Steroid 5-alpha reductase C-terminal domain-containing protein n=1 Tax=Acrasis kona TaxID=1008807 RepID=A0AAW2YGS4_9EUKA
MIKTNNHFRVLSVAYLLALLAAIATIFIASSQYPQQHITILALGNFSALCVVFAFSFATNCSNCYDPYWSVAPIFISIYWLVVAPTITPRHLYITSLVVAWGVRLTYNCLSKWGGLDDEDWRYSQWRKEWGALYWAGSFLVIHVISTLCIFLGCLPMEYIFKNRDGNSILDILASIVTISSIITEAVSDSQMKQFRKSKSGKTSPPGLWQYSRHPNYFGEVFFWVGLYLFGVSSNNMSSTLGKLGCGHGSNWMIIGPVLMFSLFNGGSIPLIEKYMVSRKPSYAEYQKSVSSFFPWFPSKQTK